MGGQGIVEYLVDVCAPCQDVSAAYAIDGVVLSDFCTRAFFGASGQTHSFTGAVGGPYETAANGVVTWLADDALLYQARADRLGRPRVHGGFSPANRARMLPRELVDMLTPDRLSRLSNAPRTTRLTDAEQNARRMRFANTTRFREDIAWRFGHASTNPAEIASPTEARRPQVFSAGGVRSGQRRFGEDVDKSVRTAS